MHRLLETLDKDRIAKAVAEAETRTAGEIVPYVVPQSDRYDVAVWRGASAAAVVALAAVMLIVRFYEGWGLGWVYTSWGVISVALAAGTAGALAAWYVYPLRRLLAGADLLDRTVHHRAMRAFVEEEVFSTRDRTGILLFVSLLEHRIEVLGDAGINAQVRPGDWADVVARIRTGIQNESLTNGLAEAVGMCGALLEEEGVDIRPDDTNELPDSVRTPDQTPDQRTPNQESS